MMQLFYAKGFEEKQELDETDSRHCVRVLRKKPGDEVWVTDGSGGLFKCSIEDADSKRVRLRILESSVEKPAARQVHLAIAPTKNMDRMSHLVEKATEIGVSSIAFFFSGNSERKSIKLGRVERVAISAMKQSLRIHMPQLTAFESLEECLANIKAKQRFIAHLHKEAVPLAKQKLEDSVMILIGPEGDFTPEEVKLAKEGGFNMVSLGGARLRTETAALVSIALLNLL